MKDFKKSPMFIVLVGIVIFFAFILVVFLFFMPNSNPINNPESSPVEENHPQEPEEALDIVDLKGALPYQGNYFSLVFDDVEGIFYVYIDPANQEEGNAELNEFLIQNGIPDKSSFPGLEEVSYPVPTQQP